MNPLTQFKKIPILPLLIALALVALASPTVARADAVTDWNLITSNAPSWVTAAATAAGAVLHPLRDGARGDVRRGQCDRRVPVSPYAVTPNVVDSSIARSGDRGAAAFTRASRVCFPRSRRTLERNYAAYASADPRRPADRRLTGSLSARQTAAGMLSCRAERRTRTPTPYLIARQWSGRLDANTAGLLRRNPRVGRERAAVYRAEQPIAVQDRRAA